MPCIIWTFLTAFRVLVTAPTNTLYMTQRWYWPKKPGTEAEDEAVVEADGANAVDEADGANAVDEADEDDVVAEAEAADEQSLFETNAAI